MDTPVDACPDTDAILSFAQGELAVDARERIAEHVDHCGECGALVLEAARALANDGSVHDDSIPPALGGTRMLARGTPVARYILLDPLGSGGLGEVYAAYDPELDRRVAIKLLKPRKGVAASTKLERRLVREGRALARVTHPHVVGVHDVGTAQGRVFIAMELVEGITLGAWLAAQPRSWTAIRDVMLGAAAGLHEAHRAGLVHRDFKPSNVIVDRDGRAKVLDFGLARAAAEAVAEPSPGSRDNALPTVVEASSDVGDERPKGDDEAVTRTGAVVGTPAYMAPEQLASGNVDARADQFSFCVTLYEALFGRRPFAGRTIAELLASIEEGRILDPTVDRRPPAWLRRAILRGLACDPAARYGSMHELAEALTQDRGSWRRPWLAVLAAVVLSSAAAWTIAASDRAAASSGALDVVESLTQEARAAAAKSYFVYPPVEDADYRTAYRVVVELEGLTDPAGALGRERAAELRSEFAATLARLGDRFWDSDGGAPFAVDYYAQALVFDADDVRARQRATLTPGELASLRAKADDLSFTASELAAAQSLAVLAEPDLAEQKRRLAALYDGEHAPGISTTERLEQVLGEEVVEAVRKTTPRASTSRRSSSEPPRVESLPREPAPLDPPPPIDPPKPPPKIMTAAEVRSAGRKAFSAGRFAEAESWLLRALDLDGKDAESAYLLGELYFERGAHGKAESFARKAVDARPKDGRYRILLGDCRLKLGRVDSAREQYRIALELGHPSATTRLQRVADAREGGTP